MPLLFFQSITRSCKAPLLLLALWLSLSARAVVAQKGFDIDGWQSGNATLRKTPLAALTSSSVSLAHTCFDGYWNTLLLPPTPSGERADIPLLDIDGYSFQSRMQAVKLVMTLDEPELWYDDMHTFQNSTNNNISEQELRPFHWLWAYAAQLDWQHQSGRLSLEYLPFSPDDSYTPSDQISTESWWGYMNFGFSIAILKGYQRAALAVAGDPSQDQLLRQIHVTLDSVSEELIQSDKGIQQTFDAWGDFFRTAYQEFRSKVLKSNTTIRKTYRQARFELQQGAWKAHTAVLNALHSTPNYDRLKHKLPSPEQQFGEGWASMVEILAACVFPTDLYSLVQDGAGFLPIRIVTEDYLAAVDNNPKNKTMPFISKVEKRRRNTVRATHQLAHMGPTNIHKMARFWKRVVRKSERFSRAMPGIVVDMTHGNPLTKLRQLARILGRYIMAPKQWLVTTGLVTLVAVAASMVLS